MFSFYLFNYLVNVVLLFTFANSVPINFKHVQLSLTKLVLCITCVILVFTCHSLSKLLQIFHPINSSLRNIEAKKEHCIIIKMSFSM